MRKLIAMTMVCAFLACVTGVPNAVSMTPAGLGAAGALLGVKVLSGGKSESQDMKKGDKKEVKGTKKGAKETKKESKPTTKPAAKKPAAKKPAAKPAKK